MGTVVDQAANRRNNERGTTLDDVSKAIIEELQQDGRRSYAAIGKAVGLSDAAVRQRFQRLLDSDVMQIVAVTNPAIPGVLRTEAYVYLRLRKQTYATLPSPRSAALR